MLALLVAGVLAGPPAHAVPLQEAIERVVERQDPQLAEVLRTFPARRHASRWIYAGIVAGHGLDAGGTILQLHRPGTVEHAPFAGSHPSDIRVLRDKGIVCGLHVAAAWILDHTGHPRAAEIFAGLAAIPAGAGVMNATGAW